MVLSELVPALSYSGCRSHKSKKSCKSQKHKTSKSCKSRRSRRRCGC